MKYLKKFNESVGLSSEDREELKQEIMDYFQEIIDEFDLEELPDDLTEDDDTPGIFYHIYEHSTLRDSQDRIGYDFVKIVIWVGNNFIDKFKTLKSDLSQLCERLNRRGYRVIEQDFDEYVEYFLQQEETGYVPEPYEIMIYYKV